MSTPCMVCGAVGREWSFQFEDRGEPFPCNVPIRTGTDFNYVRLITCRECLLIHVSKNWCLCDDNILRTVSAIGQHSIVAHGANDD